MNKTSILIFKLPELYKVLNELKNHLEFNIYYFSEIKELLNFKDNKSIDYLVLTNLENQIKDEKCQLILNKFPISIYSIIEKININLLKQKYLEQSDIFIGKYSVDLNLRLIKINTNKLKLTEREIQIIIFLNNSKTPQNIQKLQKEVWGYNSPLETHTVETHIYRLRKKILEKFADNNFIVSTKQGYKI